jgi:hypothetical protein
MARHHRGWRTGWKGRKRRATLCEGLAHFRRLLAAAAAAAAAVAAAVLETANAADCCSSRSVALFF